MTCRLFIVCLRRGCDSWMVEYVFPVVGSSVMKDSASPLPAEMLRASLVLGNFGIGSSVNDGGDGQH